MSNRPHLLRVTLHAKLTRAMLESRGIDLIKSFGALRSFIQAAHFKETLPVNQPCLPQASNLQQVEEDFKEEEVSIKDSGEPENNKPKNLYLERYHPRPGLT